MNDKDDYLELFLYSLLGLTLLLSHKCSFYSKFLKDRKNLSTKYKLI